MDNKSNPNLLKDLLKRKLKLAEDEQVLCCGPPAKRSAPPVHLPLAYFALLTGLVVSAPIGVGILGTAAVFTGSGNGPKGDLVVSVYK